MMREAQLPGSLLDIEMSDDDDIEMMGQEEYLMKHRVSSARGEV